MHAIVRLAMRGEVVVGVAVAGRPAPPPFKGFEGSHLTPWAVMADAVRRAVVGENVASAAAELRTLIGQLEDVEDGEAARLPKPRAKEFAEALDAAWGLARQAKQSGEARALQDAIAAYLTARNLAPLSAVFIGPDQACGRGEASRLRLLRRYETAPGDEEEETLSDVLMDLIDLAALEHIRDGDDDADVPGLAKTRAWSARDAVIRHLHEVSRAYPLAYRDSLLSDTDWMNDFLDRVDLKPVTDEDLPEEDDDWSEAAEDWSLASGNLCLARLKRSAYRGKSQKVLDIEFEGRGNTLLNTQGHHVTAHVLIEETVRRAVLGKAMPDALNGLIALTRQLPQLATYRDPGDLSRRDDPKGIYARAYATFTATQGAAVLAAEDTAVVLTEQTAATEDIKAALAKQMAAIEDLAAAYVMMRNALPMAAIQRGAPADGKAEGRVMARLRQESQKARIDDGQVCGYMWQLLDTDALDELYTNDDDPVHTWAPAAPRDTYERLRQLLAVHLTTLEAAFPALAKSAKVRSVKSVTWLLKRKGLPLPNGLVKDLSLGQELVSPMSPFSKGKIGQKSRDDDEWKERPRRCKR
jgi:hypothetical protein